MARQAYADEYGRASGLLSGAAVEPRGHINLTDAMRGVTLAPERLVGAPVDIVNMAMGGLGIPVSKRPYMGSDWLIENNPLRSPENMPTHSASEIAGDVLGTVLGDPALGAAKLAGLLGLGLGAAVGSIKGVKRATDLADIRGMPVDEAVAVARREEHLIPRGKAAEGKAAVATAGKYVGGPRNIKSKRALTALRKKFDDFVAKDHRGADWYDRYRDNISEVTGTNRLDSDWMAAQQATYSAGVSPGSEVAFAIKGNNASLAGMDATPRFPAQRAGERAAIAANDPSLIQLGPKTGEYKNLTNPNRPGPPGATGVNDFRNARNWGYTQADGSPQTEALTAAQHFFIDRETALAVDRANKARLGGRENWTGDQLQAAPWVRQKAMSILEQRPAILQRHLDDGVPEGRAAEMAYEEAFSEATKTIGDHFPKHEMYATHEAMPGPGTGHMPGSVDATQAERVAFAADPRGSWANAPGGRDAIYSGQRLGDTGVAMRVRPTKPMQGMYQPPGGLLEVNPGEVARPLVAYNTDKATGLKSLAPADRALVEPAESLRAYVDAQDAAAAHKHWTGGRPAQSSSLFTPLEGQASMDELLAVRDAVKRRAIMDPVHGLPDVVDTGSGLTVSSFWPPAAPASKKQMGLLSDDIVAALPNRPNAQPIRTNVDSVYKDYTAEWAAGEGSDAATRKLLDDINRTPEIRTAFDDNPHLADNALSRLQRDKDWESKWGAGRKDIERARKEIAKGPGWVGRLEALIGKGVLPAIFVGAVLSNVELKTSEPS